MKNLLKHKIILTLIAILYSSSLLYAGSSQAGGEIHYKPEEIIKFAKKVEKTLAQKGARIAILGRVGRDRESLPEGISFTHTAFAVYSQITTADNRKIPGYAIYNLYQRDKTPDVSDLVIDYPVDFFAGVELLEAGIIIPTPELQKRLLKVIASDTYKNLHNSNYSVIANPFTVEYQNCTEHTLDVITSAIYQTNDLQKIKANEKAYFTALKLDVNPLKLALGSMFISDVSISDHPNSPETTTFTTIGDFLTKYKMVSEKIILKP